MLHLNTAYWRQPEIYLSAQIPALCNSHLPSRKMSAVLFRCLSNSYGATTNMQKPMMKYHYSLIKSYFLKKRSQKHRRRWEMHLWHLVYSILLYFTVLLLISFFEYLSPTIYGFCLTECTFSLFRIRSTINKLLQFLSS